MGYNHLGRVCRAWGQAQNPGPSESGWRRSTQSKEASAREAVGKAAACGITEVRRAFTPGRKRWVNVPEAPGRSSETRTRKQEPQRATRRAVLTLARVNRSNGVTEAGVSTHTY